MPDHHYLSIGEVLGLLLEDFPDVTISKIRFLESQGLIEPERTPSGYRKFYDHDVDLLRAILHEQRENFLPLKVIRDRIESGGIQPDPNGVRTPPRGIRNVETRNMETRNVETRNVETRAMATASAPSSVGEQRDSVFRRTDGGPEWADGRALIPGDPQPHAPSSPITTSVAVVPSVPAEPAVIERITHTHTEIDSVSLDSVSLDSGSVDSGPLDSGPVDSGSVELAVDVAALIESPKPAVRAEPVHAQAQATSSPRTSRQRPLLSAQDLPLDRDELCAAAAITVEQLAELESYGLIHGRGNGKDTTYPTECVEIAAVAGRFLANGIDARHLRTWRQAAEREAALFEQRIMPLLRQRNPQSRQTALDTLTELADLGGQLRSALVQSALHHHFDGT